jgi:DNA polymerase-3 subunit beta
VKFEIQKTDFLKLLQETQNIIEKRNTMPILANVLLKAEEGKVSVFATDLEVSLRDEVAAKVEVQGAVAVSAKNLFDLVKELSDANIQVVKKSNNWLEIRSQKAVFNIVGAASDDFPAFPQHSVKDMVTVDSQILHDMIVKTIYSVSNDETRYHLNGVYFERTPGKEGGSFRMVATDGHRLSLIDKKVGEPTDTTGKAEGVIIPKKGLYEIKRLLESSDGPLEMGFEGSHLVIRKESAILLIRLIDGKYPNYQQLIPVKLMKKIAVSRESLLSCLRRVSLLSNQKSKGITLSINKNAMEIYSNNPEIGDAKEEIDIAYDGEALKIGFNAKYLMDILNNIQDEEIDIELNDQLSPGILRPAKDSGYTCVVMPMRI